MKFSTTAVAFSLVAIPTNAFTHSFNVVRNSAHRILTQNKMSSLNDDTAKRMQEIFNEESQNPESLAQTAERMKNLSSTDLDQLISQVNSMPQAQRDQLKSMGMDPDMMLRSMKLMRDNPGVRESAQKMMEKMSPEELLQQSRITQEKMKAMTQEQLDSAAEIVGTLSKEQIDEAAEKIASDGVIDLNDDNSSVSEKKVDVPFEGSAKDPAVLDAMYKVAEFMSQPPTGKVTFKAFSSLPVIVSLSGNSEQDLSARELKECWEDGSLGATRVDRVGFERVWNEVIEYFEDDIMEEARKTITKRGQAMTTSKTTTTTTVTNNDPPIPQVGANLSPEQMKNVNEQVKNLSDDDMTSMLEQMNDMTPEQEARMKAMGVDPTMMKRASGIMKNNPMMMKAAQAMMKNMKPEQMLKMSQEAQKKISTMSPEEYEKALEQMKNTK